MNQYIFFVLGILLGLAIALYIYESRKEKIISTIIMNQKVFSSEKLNETIENIAKKISIRMQETNKELSEDEKNEIIASVVKRNFC